MDSRRSCRPWRPRSRLPAPATARCWITPTRVTAPAWLLCSATGSAAGLKVARQPTDNSRTSALRGFDSLGRRSPSSSEAGTTSAAPLAGARAGEAGARLWASCETRVARGSRPACVLAWVCLRAASCVAAIVRRQSSHGRQSPSPRVLRVRSGGNSSSTLDLLRRPVGWRRRSRSTSRCASEQRTATGRDLGLPLTPTSQAWR
jgi:hypothetical protein